MRISCLFKLRHSCNQPYSTCFPPLLWWTGIWIQNGRRSKEFSMLWPQLIPWPSPHSLISQPEAASFRPLPFNGSFHCSVVHRLTPMDQKRDVHTVCTCIAKYGFSVCIFYSIMYFLQCLHHVVATLARCGTTPCPSFCPHSTGLQQSDPIGPWNVRGPSTDILAPWVIEWKISAFTLTWQWVKVLL